MATSTPFPSPYAPGNLLPAHTGLVNSCSSGNREVLTNCGPGIKIYNPQTGELLRTLNKNEQTVWACNWDAGQVAMVGEDGTVEIWDMQTGKILHRLSHTQSIHACVYTDHE